LEPTDAGFDASVLSEFRTRLIAGAAEYLLFDTLLQWCHERQLVKASGRQRTDSTHILAAVRALNRIEVVGETMAARPQQSRHCGSRVVAHREPPDWQDHHARRAEDDRLPATQAARATLALTIGKDGWRLLSAIDHSADGAALPKIHAALQQRGLLPDTHIVDTGFLDAARLVESQDLYGVDLLGPTRQDYH
jgi:transposase